MQRPKARRLALLAPEQQWIAAIHLAVSIAECKAAQSDEYNLTTREQAWLWRGCPHDTASPDTTGWWMIPQRVATRARRLVAAAIAVETWDKGGCSGDQIVVRLKRWRRSGRWRAIVAAGNASKLIRRPAKTEAQAERERQYAMHRAIDESVGIEVGEPTPAMVPWRQRPMTTRIGYSRRVSLREGA